MCPQGLSSRRFVGPHIAAAFVLILLYCLPAIQALQISNPASLPVTHDEGQFLILTDIHFDPFSGNDPHTIQALASSPVEKWQAILQPSASREPSRDGADSNYALLISALQAARQSAHYDYLLVPGDSLAHHFAEKYDEFHPGEGYQEFAIKTLVFVNRMIQQAFPGVPIFYALGNNDSIDRDYGDPGKPLLVALSEEWQAVGGNANRDFLSGGYYAARHPTVASQELIFLNTSLWSRLYTPSTSLTDLNAGEVEMTWLASRLDEVRAQHLTASLVMHIPPGIDAYATAHNGSEGPCNTPLLFWKKPFLDSFIAIINSHKEILRDSYAGHTHINDFRIFTDASGMPYFQTNIAPSLSPDHHNPEFEIGVYDKADGSLVDYAVEYLEDSPGGGSPTVSNWRRAYDFRALSTLPIYSPASLQTISLLIRSSSAIRSRLLDLFATHNRAARSISAREWLPYSCAETEITPGAFTLCSCPLRSNH